MSICVLTGDIVGSTRLPRAQQDRVHVILEQAHTTLTKDMHGTFDTYRGDGWQMDFNDGKVGLRFALYIRACLRSESEDFETRIAIASGDETSVLLGNGSQTYIASGRTLDTMPRDIFMSDADQGAAHAVTVLLDYISRNWTQSQARAIRSFLLVETGRTQKDVAAELGNYRQAVGQALDAAGYPTINRALTALEAQAK